MEQAVIVEPGVEYIPLEDAMEHYWRIKKFKIFAPSSTITIQYGSLDDPEVGVVAIDTITMYPTEIIFDRGDARSPAFRIPTKEEDLVCGRYTSGGKIYDITWFEFSFYGTSTTVFPSLEPFGFPPYTRSVSQTTLILNEFFFGDRTPGYLIDPANNDVAIKPFLSPLIGNLSPFYSLGSISWELSSNFTFGPFPYYFSGVQGSVLEWPPISKTGSYDISIVPYEWWPYGGTYNPSTGQPA